MKLKNAIIISTFFIDRKQSVAKRNKKYKLIYSKNKNKQRVENPNHNITTIHNPKKKNIKTYMIIKKP